MAIAKELKEQILSDFHTGTFSQRELAINHSVGIGTINRLTKGLNAKNGTLVCDSVDTTIKQNEIMEQIGTLNGTERNSVQKAVQDQLRRSEKVFGNAELMASVIPNIINSSIIEETDEETGEVSKKYVIDAQDLRTLVEANDKLAITLKVAERHAPKIAIDNTNAQQNNNNLTKAEISQAIAESLPD